MLSVLRSLWAAVDAPAAERSAIEQLMAGPLGLHARSLEKVCASSPAACTCMQVHACMWSALLLLLPSSACC